MATYREDFGVSTSKRNQMTDITEQVREVVRNSGIECGQVVVFCTHTTGAITINENADPDVVHDMLLTLNELFPAHRDGYRHMEGNSDSHCKSSTVGCSETLVLDGGSLVLGTWQGIYFCEFDGPRSRKVCVSVVGE